MKIIFEKERYLEILENFSINLLYKKDYKRKQHNYRGITVEHSQEFLDSLGTIENLLFKYDIVC